MAWVEKFGVKYEFEDEGDRVRIRVQKGERGKQDFWEGELNWPSEDMLSLYHALGDFLIMSSRATPEEIEK